MFQFHIGAIRRRRTLKGSWCGYPFQFHIGAIRRRRRSMPARRLPRFNSILVQLEVSSYDTVTQDSLSFQFHIGAIRSRRSSGNNARVTSFNSILVQLEVAIQLPKAARPPSFNSILVQLEGRTKERERFLS